MAIPLLFLLEGKSWRTRIVLGLGWGVLAHGLLIWWLLPISPVGYCVFVLALSLQGAIFGALMAGALRWPETARLFYIPCAWVVSEYLRNRTLGGFTWGLGESQAGVPSLIQSARFGGVYAVSWLMVLFAAACYLRIKHKGAGAVKDPPSLMLVVFPLCVWIAGAAAMAMEDVPKERSLRVVLVQPNISRAEKASASLYNENMNRHLILSKKGAQQVRPDIIVWPETAFPDDIMRDALWRPRMETVARNFNAWFIFGSALLSDDGHDLNAVLFLDPKGKWRDVYYKRYLVPFTEYLPGDRASAWLARVGGMQSYHFLPGQRRGMAYLDGPNVVVGAVICSEEAYPALFRDLAQNDAGVFIGVLNDGWFTRPEALMLHAEMAVFRAVETGRPLVRAANTGWSAGIDSRGRAIRTAVLQSPGWVAVDVHPGKGRTLYVRFGDVFVWLCAGFVIIILMGKRRSGCLGLVLLALVLPASDAGAAAAVQRRAQQQKQMQAQQIQQYQQQLQQQQYQQYQQQLAEQQQAQQVAAYKQAAAQKAAEEYAAQKQAMEAAVAKKQAEQQAAQVVTAVAQDQAQQVSQYQQAVASNNVAAMVAYKQAQQVKAYQDAQAQAQLNGDIKQYAEYTMKRNALMQAQAAQAAQEETDRQLLTQAAYQKTAVMKKRSELNAAYQEDVRRRMGKQLQDTVMAPRAAEGAAADSAAAPAPETTVGLEELWAALDHSARPWVKIVDREIKLLTVSQFIDRFRKGGIVISHSPGEYVGKIDSVAAGTPEMLNSPFGNLLSYVAIMDYDFENGQNKDELARQVLGDANFWSNKRRLQRK